MLQLYGNPQSRATRCLWMLEEIREPYQLIEKSTRTEDLQSADYLKLNPNARIPTLVDGDVVVWESMAINLYLAEKYQGPMHFAGPHLAVFAATTRLALRTRDPALNPAKRWLDKCLARPAYARVRDRKSSKPA
jgi:glutathione S-transferase